jgi:hypothetical protein
VRGQPSQHPYFKCTREKASLKHPPRGMRGCTTLQLQLLCFAEKAGDWANSVKYLVTKPKLSAWAIVCGLIFGHESART